MSIESEFDDIIIPPPPEFADTPKTFETAYPTNPNYFSHDTLHQHNIERCEKNISDYYLCAPAQKLYYYNVKKLKEIAKDKHIPNFYALRRDELIDTLTKYYSLPLNLQHNYILDLQNQYKLLNKIQSDKRKADKVDKKLKMWIN